ncbi:MAG: hypothetical protein NUW02_02700 [Candidatus Campbellbacteria bacterium]|nr:hypothetical protein [Candidatus Campbellbacteria bacterium]
MAHTVIALLETLEVCLMGTPLLYLLIAGVETLTIEKPQMEE